MAKISKRALEILAYLDTEEGDGDLIVDGDRCWFGEEKTSIALVYRLLREGLLRISLRSSETCIYYGITEEGRKVLANPEYEPMLRRFLRGEEMADPEWGGPKSIREKLSNR